VKLYLRGLDLRLAQIIEHARDLASKDMLKTRIEQFIAYFNATMAKPFRWTYAGKPLAGAMISTAMQGRRLHHRQRMPCLGSVSPRCTRAPRQGDWEKGSFLQ
jgi:hypothetical protein